MRREYLYIAIILLIMVVKIALPSSEVKVEGIESGNDNNNETVSEPTIDTTVEPTNAEVLNIDPEDLESLTVDEKTGESCNEYIPTLIETGVASYKISPENTIFDYFCSQTVGADSYDDMDLTGYEEPMFIHGAFEDIPMNDGTDYVALTEYTDDVYLACYLTTDPVGMQELGWWDQINCDFSLIDSHVYFTPEKVLDESTMTFYLTDVKFGDHMLSEYYEELGKIQMWYGEHDYHSPEDFVANTPTEEELDFSIVDYDAALRVIEELQKIVGEDY